jgi:tripartite-type tricarboxylate transporter receptor subunit TctC
VRFAGWTFSIVLMLAPEAASAQSYPTKPIRIVTAESGGSSDFSSRIVAQWLTSTLGEQVIVDNRGASGGVIAAQIVARAQPDAYTLLFYGSNIWLMPFLRDSVPYDPIGDFSPISLTNVSPNVLVVHPSVAQSVKELIALAKAKPGALNYASGGTGSSNHLAAEMFKSMVGVDIVRVPFKGAGPAIGDLLTGQLQMAFFTPPSVIPHIKSGRLRALAVTSLQPTALVSGVPTLASTGVPGYEMTSMYGLFAPAKTPASLITRLNREVVQGITRPEAKEKFFSGGSEVVGSTPDEFLVAVKAEMARLGKVIKAAGIRGE